jgi:predicted RNase H-like HicB family nuclease
LGYKAIVHRAEEGGYWAEVPELPGLVTEGDTLDELVAALDEAVQGWWEADALRKEHKGRRATVPDRRAAAQ